MNKHGRIAAHAACVRLHGYASLIIVIIEQIPCLRKMQALTSACRYQVKTTRPEISGNWTDLRNGPRHIDETIAALLSRHRVI